MRPAARTWGLRPRMLVDVVLAVSFLALMSVNLTGLLLHEWWGLVLMLLVIVHLLAQWDWTIASSRNFVARLTARIRLTYVLNWALFVAAVLVFVSGILISENALPALGLPTARTGGALVGFWHQLHTLSADAVLVLAAVHLGLNWRWVVNAVKQIFHVGSRGRRLRLDPKP
jgi:cytochrome b561